MELILVRHTTPKVEQGICYGQTDLAVAETFDQEAQEVAKQLAAIKPTRVFTSPLQRCRALASFCGYPMAQIDERLMEKNFGLWEMKRWTEITGPEAERWYANWIDEAPPGGESLRMQYTRLAAFLDELRRDYAMGKDEHLLIFTHGGIQILAGIYAGLYPMAGCFEHTLPYGGILRLTLNP